MLAVNRLSKKYDDYLAVKEVSFFVPKGEVLVLLGTSGCGKTTTLKMINRLVEKTSGSVTIHGRDADAVDPFSLRRDIGYVIQETGLFPHYTVEQNIGTVPELLGWEAAKISARVEELLDLIGLDQNVRSRMPHQLSGGQRQRVGLARALAADPSIILLDEPFGALDPISRREMQLEFVQLEGALDKAMVLVTHDVTEAIALGDQICLMDKGVVQQIGSAKQLIFSPANSFVKAFFDSKRIELEPAIVTLSDLTVGLKPLAVESAKKVAATLTLTDALKVQGDDQPISFVIDGQHFVVHDVLQTYYQFRKGISKKLGADG